MNEIDKNSDGSDLFEEFEFKPITEGLGFHKKAEQIKNSISESRLGHSTSGRIIPDRPSTLSESARAQAPAPTPATDSMAKLMASLPPMKTPNLDFKEDAASPISTSTKQIASELSRTTPQPSGFRQSEFQARLEESFAKAFPQPGGAKARSRTSAVRASAAAAAPLQTQNLSLEPIAASISGAIVDALTVVGVSILCLVIILSITKADLFALLHNSQTDTITQFNLVLLFASALQLYMLVARSFFGITLGEWAFDAQLGSAKDQKKALYPLQVAIRTLIATATLFVLPIISKLTGKDLLRPFSGLQLYGRANDQENI